MAEVNNGPGETVVFLDTEVYVQQNFQYAKGLLDAFRQHVQAGRFRHVTTDVTRSEVRSKIDGAAESASAALKRFRGDARVLRNSGSPSLSRVFKGLSQKKLRQTLTAQFDAFLEELDTEVVAIDTVAPSEVFGRYFKGRPPFGAPKKKAEFPDAFALEALRMYAESSGCRITVVSADQDWAEYAKDEPTMEIVSGLEDLLKDIQEASPLYAAAVEAVTGQNAEIQQAIAEECLGLGFFVVDRPATVVDVNVSLVDIHRTNVVNVTSEAVIFSLESWVSFDVHVEYPPVPRPSGPTPWDVAGTSRSHARRADQESPLWASETFRVVGTLAWDPENVEMTRIEEVNIVDGYPVSVYIDEYSS